MGRGLVAAKIPLEDRALQRCNSSANGPDRWPPAAPRNSPGNAGLFCALAARARPLRSAPADGESAGRAVPPLSLAAQFTLPPRSIAPKAFLLIRVDVTVDRVYRAAGPHLCP